jgi:hypothetical protein
MIKFIIIGMMCNSQGCYWAQAENEPTIYESVEACRAKAADWKRNTVMYFQMDCMAYTPKTTS